MKYLYMICCAIVCLGVSAQNLVRNADFSQLSPAGLPKDWEFRQVGGTVDGAELKLKGKGVLVQSAIPLEAGKKYLLSWEVRSEAGSKYRVYCEWRTNATKQFRSSGAPERQAEKEWKKMQTGFTYEADCTPPYLAVAIGEGAEIDIRNLKIEPFGAVSGSGRKALGGEWFVSAPTKFVTEDGREALRVESDGRNANAFLRGVKLTPGKSYSLTYSVKSYDANPNASEFFPFNVNIEFAGVKDKLVSPWDDTWGLGFQNKTFNFTVPENAKGDAVIELYSRKRPIFFGNFELKERQAEPEIKHPMVLTQPLYRNLIFSSMPVDEIKGKIKTGTAIKQVQVKLEKDGIAVFEKSFANTGAELEFTIPAAKLVEGTYKLSVRPDNEEPAALELKKLPKAPVEVVMGPDKLFRFNGKPFFPVMFWGGNFIGVDDEEKFHALARNGVNMIFTHGENKRKAMEILDLANRNGIKVIVNTGYPKRLDDDTLKNWIHNTSELTSEIASHPALFGYFIADEPWWGGVPLNNLLKAYDTLKELDPYHPAWINAAPRGSIADHQQYSRAADIYGVDIYPVGSGGHSGLEDKTLSAVGRYVLHMNETVHHRKPVWMVLQGFAWKSLGGTDNGEGYPTPAQDRFVVYDSLVEGAQGIVWWGLAFVKTASFYDTLFGTARELQTMTGLLTDGKELGKAQVSNPAIRTRTLEANGKKYVIAVNGTANNVSATINPAFTAAGVKVFQENRSLPVKNGAVTDTFDAYSVHVYGEAELPPSSWPLPVPDSRYDFAKNPVTRNFSAYHNNIPYDGQANWIWEASKARVAGSETVLHKTFTLDVPVKSAALIAAADDYGTVSINGRELGKAGGFTIAAKLDAAALLKQGENTISVSAADGGQLPCGLLIDLRIELTNGKKVTVITDETWQANASDKVAIIAPYGGGAWGARTKLPE